MLGGRRKLYFVERPRKEKALRGVCSEEEIRQILKSVENIKHKAILSTIYSAGLRIGGSVSLPITATDSDQIGIQIRIEKAKGKKDRYTNEVYRHITTQGFNQLVSPLDKLDI